MRAEKIRLAERRKLLLDFWHAGYPRPFAKNLLIPAIPGVKKNGAEIRAILA